MLMKVKYNEIPLFQRDLKHLLKKYQTLKEDLEVVKRYNIEGYHYNRFDNAGIFPIPGFCSEKIQVCKIKKFACKALKGRGSRSGIRVIYAFHCENYRIDFIEIYFKSDNENEDRDRIKDYLKNYPY